MTGAHRLDQLARAAGCTDKELEALAAYFQTNSLRLAAALLRISLSTMCGRLDRAEERIRRYLDERESAA